MSYKRYAKYKPSGIEWIGEIPEGWRSLAIKRLSPVKRGASPRPIDDPKYFDDSGDYAWVRIADVSASDRYLEKTTQQLSELGSSLSVKRQPGDIFLSIAGSVGKPIISKIKCCIHDGFVYFPDLDVNPEYLYYLFTTGLLFKGLGKWGTQLNLNTETVGDISIPMPSSNEIDNIVTFLDRKTTQIDKLIEIKRKQVELLKEERTAIINQAVTKGLNPDAKMKESGIEWIGEIPEGWEITKLKRVVADMVSGPFGSALKKEEYSKVGYRVYGQEQVIPGNFKIGDYYIPFEKYQSLERYAVSPGDILVSCVGTFGKIAVVPADIEPGVINPRLIRLEPDQEQVLPHYLEQLLSSTMVFGQFEQISRGGTMGVINLGLLSELTLPIPTLEEQPSLLEKITRVSAGNSKAIKLQEQQIQLLQEYRTTLISDAVTGKIDIREEAA